MFDAREYEEFDFDRRRPNRRDNTARNSTSANKGRARRSSGSARKSSKVSVSGLHNRKNKHWNW